MQLSTTNTGQRRGAGTSAVLGNRSQNILVACHELGVSGGLYRFERFGRVIRKLGHRLAFVAFSQTPQRERTTEFQVLSLGEAAREAWDVTIVPGQGFPEATIDRLSMLVSSCFGLRVQHILNDQTRKRGFLKVNAAFKPDVIIFNNRHWRPGDFTDFDADAFHYLEGAVDLEAFAQNPPPTKRPCESSFVIGGLSQKNPQPLIEAVRSIGNDVRLCLFGKTAGLADRHRDLIDEGRLQLLGVLGELELPIFYSGLDCVVHTELFAGWANLVAEGMASSIPVVCTPHGTLAFAEHEVTALIVPDPTPATLAKSIQRLRSDPSLANRLARTALRRIQRFSWDSYSVELLGLMKPPRARYYTCSPELGLFGKWPETTRLAGLEMLLADCMGKTVLDLGASEGVISLRMLEKGAATVHGFDREPSRVRLASAMCSQFEEAQFWVADLSSWSTFLSAHRAHLQVSYDIVCYLGVHQHLPAANRMVTLEGSALRTSDWFAVRMPSALFCADNVLGFLENRGFTLVSTHTAPEPEIVGSCYIFRRRWTIGDPES